MSDTYRLIDSDVHPLVMNAADTFPYMPVAWRKHFDFPEFLAAAARVDRYRGMPPASVDPNPVNANPKRLASDHLEANGMDLALLVPMQGASLNARVDAAASAVLAAALNGYFIEKWLEADQRYRLAACVAPQEPRRAAREIRQRAKDPRVAAVLLPLWTLPMGSNHYDPIYAAAEESGLPIVIHPTGVEGHYQGVQQLGAGTHRSVSSRQVLLHELAESNISSLIFEGVFVRHPGLRVIFSECSFAWSASFIWRLDKEARNFYFEMPWMKDLPSVYFRRHIRLATQPLGSLPAPEGAAAEVARLAHAEDTVMYGSHFPLYDHEPPSALDRLPESIQDSVRHGLAESTLRLALHA